MSGTQSKLIGISGGIKPNGLINGVSVLAGPAGDNPFATDFANAGINQVLSGSVTANTLVTVLSLTGKGVLSHLSCGHPTTPTSRTHRMKVTLDGIVIFDATSVSNIATAPFNAIGGLQVIRTPTGSYLLCSTTDYCFDQSLLIEYTSSVTGVNAAAIFYKYAPRA